MNHAGLEAINDHLTLVEFAVQDLTETELVESAQDALQKAQTLCRTLEKYVTQEKEIRDGYRVQSCDIDRQSGQGSSGQRRRYPTGEFFCRRGPRPNRRQRRTS